MYQHRFSLDRCPQCHQDLHAAGSVEFTAHDNLGRFLGSFPSRLGEAGELVDVDRWIAAGKHSGTQCGHCGEPLDCYEA